jgi:hypothetical protein
MGRMTRPGASSAGVMRKGAMNPEGSPLVRIDQGRTRLAEISRTEASPSAPESPQRGESSGLGAALTRALAHDSREGWARTAKFLRLHPPTGAILYTTIRCQRKASSHRHHTPAVQGQESTLIHEFVTYRARVSQISGGGASHESSRNQNAQWPARHRRRRSAPRSCGESGRRQPSNRVND